MKKTLALPVLFLFFIACKKQPEGAWTVETVPDPKKSPTQISVSDPDNFIDPGNESTINGECWKLEQSTGIQFAIVVLKSIGSEVPKTFATNLFNRWGVGKSGRDNGLLLLVVIDQKRWEFETGYGLEGDLTDIQCKRIGESNLVPYFKEQQYGLGILYAVRGVQNELQSFTVQRYQDLLRKTDAVMATGDSSRIKSFTDSLRIADSVQKTYVQPAVTKQMYNDYYANYREPEPLSETSWTGIFFGFVFTSWILFIIWGVVTYKKPEPGKQVKNLVLNKPRPLIFICIGLLPTLTWLGLMLTDGFEYPAWAVAAAFYFSVMLVITDYRIRRNKKVFSSQKNVYLVYSDFRKSHSVWTAVMPLIFPVFYIPYLFWYYSVCRKMRRESRPCTKCNTLLTYEGNVITELEDDKYLSKGQLKEEYLKSRDWDVWLCKSCSQVDVLGYKAFYTRYDNCPACGFITEKYLGSQTITPATYDSTGTGVSKYRCVQCNNYREVTYTIPVKTRPSSSSSGGGSSGGGSSWGGGRSGGGGAGGGW